MAKYYDIDTDVRINGGLTLPSGSVTVGTTITLDNTSGQVTATKFSGDGSLLTNLSASNMAGVFLLDGSKDIAGNMGVLGTQIRLRGISDGGHYIAYQSTDINGNALDGIRISGYSGVELVQTNGNGELATFRSTGINLNAGTTISGLLTANGGLTVGHGNDLILQAGDTRPTDSGDIVFNDNTGTEIARFWYPGSGNFNIRFGPNDTSKTLWHSGNFDPTTKLDGTTPYVGLDTTGSTQFVRIVAKNNPATDTTEGWFRIGEATSGGLIPYQDGQNYVGTSSWKFSQIHSVNFYENGTALSSKYLGISAQAADSAKVGGVTASSFVRNDTATRIGDNVKLYFGSASERFIMKDTTADAITISEVANIKIIADSDSSSTTEYASVGAGQNVLKVQSSGGSQSGSNITYNGNIVYHAGNLSVSSFLTTGTSQATGTGFTVKGTNYVGNNGNVGNLAVTDNSGTVVIHLDGGSSGSALGGASTKVYIQGNGSATFGGTVAINKLTVTDTGVVSNLNASKLNGFVDTDFAKNAALLDQGGYGLYSGFGVSATSTPGGNVNIAAGVAYLDNGRRVSISTMQVGFNAASTTYDRYDVVYIKSSASYTDSAPFAVVAGTPAASPVAPSVPAGGIAIAQVLIKQNAQGGVTITDGTGGTANQITDIRQWRPYGYDGTTFTLVGKILNAATLKENGVSLVSKYAQLSAANNFTANQNISGQVKAVWSGAGSSNYYFQATDNTNSLSLTPKEIIGTDSITMTSGTSGINLNGGAVTTGSTLTVAGGNLTVSKSGNWSYITFPAQSNDRGFIGHYENNNASELRFVVGDDAQDTDYFTFGSQTGTTTTISDIQAGTWTEGARITAAGNATFKGLTVNGTATMSAGISIPNSGSSTDGKGITFVNGSTTSRISTAAGNDFIIQADEIRFGTSASSWDYNVWGGIKYSSAATTLTIGGPVAFRNNSSTTRITLAMSGTDAISMDGKVTINPVNSASISGTTMANGHLLLGTTSNGLALDVDEITSSGSALYLETIGAYNITLKPNNTTVLDVSTTGATVTGTLSSTGVTTLMNYYYFHNTNEFNGSGDLYINYRKGSDGVTGNAGNTNINVNNGSVRIGTNSGSDKLTVSGTTYLNGKVGINTAPNSSYTLTVGGDAYLTSWIRTAGATGWYNQDYGGGWYMADTTWIQSYGSKQVYINNITRVNTLQVGTGTTYTAANDLQVTPSGTLNFRNTIWSDGNHSAIRKTSGAHSLDVYSNVAWEGINLQTSDDTLSMGYNFQNSGGSYAWSMSRVNSSTASYPDLVFYGGNASSISGLPEVLRLYHSKGMKLQGNAMIAGTSALNQDPSITLALGDADTGLNWASDGNFNIMANNTNVASISATLFNPQIAFRGESNISVSAASGRGFRFWDSDSYKIYMSATGDSTWGGSISTITNTDYNIYFRIQGGGTRGFAFQTNNGIVAQIDQAGEIHSSTGFRTKNYAMEYNSTEDSLDFVYYG